jgi:hypothetical protein
MRRPAEIRKRLAKLESWLTDEQFEDSPEDYARFEGEASGLRWVLQMAVS